MLTILLIPVFLVGFTVVHELGHTLLARAAGDSQAVFYLWRIDENGTCLGCTITDPTRLTAAENLVVALGGLLATQPVAVLLLLAARRLAPGTYTRRVVVGMAFFFAFDVVVQGVQGLIYDLNTRQFPTSTDLTDVMLLARQLTSLGQPLLKTLLVVICAAWLAVFGIIYWRAVRAGPAAEPRGA